MATGNDDERAKDVPVTYCRYAVCKDALPVAAAGLTFLSLNKKVSKEVSPGEALTAKPFGTASVALAGQPDFEPPSPGYPSRPPSVTGQESNMGSVAERNVVSGSLSLRCGVYRQQLSLRAAKRRGNPQKAAFAGCYCL